MWRKSEAVTPADVLKRLTGMAGEDVLIGGQALAVWAEPYGIQVPQDVSAISRDVDFLTTSPTAKERLQCYADVPSLQT